MINKFWGKAILGVCLAMPLTLNAAVGTLSVRIDGAAAGGSLATVLFPATGVNTATPPKSTIKLTAATGGMVTLYALGEDSPDFQIENTTCKSVTGGNLIVLNGDVGIDSFCEFDIVFTPKEVGWRSALLAINSNATNTLPVVYLQGNATPPPANTTTLALASAPDQPTTADTTVTFTATVNGTSNIAGSVTFAEGGTTIPGCNSVALSGTGPTRTATCAKSGAFTAGAHTVTAAFTSTSPSTDTDASNTWIRTVAAPPAHTTTVAVASNPVAPTTLDNSVTFTATLGTSSSATGSVTFAEGGTTIPGCNSVALSGTGTTRTATCAKSGAFTAGAHTVTAAFTSTSLGTDTSATGAWNYTVLATPAHTTTVAVASNPVAPTTSDASVTFTATIGATTNVTGSVTFSDSGNVLCNSVALSGTGATRTATCTTQSALTAGMHTITATFTSTSLGTDTSASGIWSGNVTAPQVVASGSSVCGNGSSTVLDGITYPANILSGLVLPNTLTSVDYVLGRGQVYRLSQNRGESRSIKITTDSADHFGDLVLEMTTLGNNVDKFMTISTTRCDFRYELLNTSCGATSAVNVLYYQVAGDTSTPTAGGRCRLSPNTTYYINIRNEFANTTTRKGNLRGIDSCLVGTTCGYVFQIH